MSAKGFLTATTVLIACGCHGRYGEKQVTADNLKEKHDQIQNGMDYLEVVSLLGLPDKSGRARVEGPGVVVSHWKVDIGAGFTRYLTVHFKDGKVFAKNMRMVTGTGGKRRPQKPPEPPEPPNPPNLEAISRPPVHRVKVLTAENVQEKYNQVQKGMKHREVETILGLPDNAEVSPSDPAAKHWVVARHWYVDIEGGSTRHLIVHFTGQKVTAKFMNHCDRRNSDTRGSAPKLSEPPKPPK